MRHSLWFIICCLLWSFDLWAGPGKVIIKGADENVCIYNSLRGRGRTYFSPEKEAKETVITLPEKECTDLFYLISGDRTSWLRVLPDETVTVDMRKKDWNFSGDSKAINRYLYRWTQQMFFGKPNALTYRVEMMFHQLPNRDKRIPDFGIFYTNEYMEWMKHAKDEAMNELTKAKLKDGAFVKEQERRIYDTWLEMQLQNYQLASDKKKIPAEAFDFLRDIRFDDASSLKYPGIDDILRGYYDMTDACGLIPYDNYNFLQRRAERIANAEIREYYILQELDTYIRCQWLYQLDQVMASVEEMVVTDAGKEQLAEYKNRLQELSASKANKNGEKVVNIQFKDVNDKEWGLHMFKGKYVLIDVWATWCGPCKYQIPYLMRLEEELAGRGIVFVSLSADKPENTQKWKDMVNEFGMKGICGIAPDAFNHAFFEKYEVKSIPRFILLDPDGNIVMSKARRPSDPVLKMQLKELLEQYDREKTVISGRIEGIEDGMQVYVNQMNDMMTNTLCQTEIRDGRFEASFILKHAGFIRITCGRIFSGNLWANPGEQIAIEKNESCTYSGGEYELNNLLAALNAKYDSQWPKFEDKFFDKKRGKQSYDTYMSIKKEIDAANLRPEMKRILIGYFQGTLLNNMYGRVATSKVFGKGFARPIVKPGYSDAVLKLELLPEVMYYSNWMDGVQELLYARLAAGMVKIQWQGTYLNDMATGLKDGKLKETYLIKQLQMEILRGHLVGVEERIENARTIMKEPDNIALLSQMPKEVKEALQRYKTVLPGTDLSRFAFENEKGEQVSLSDFKGKYVFIDIWSTGCNPCVGEVPYIKDMEHRFAGKPIAWVSISMDLNKKTWTDFLKKEEMKGVQLLSKGFKDPFSQQIALSGIPRFLLLDKEGKVLDFSSLRPSNPVLGKLLEILLK